MIRRPPRSTPFPYPTLFRSRGRLRLLEFDSEVQSRPGIVHQTADAISGMPSDGEDTDPLDDEIPTLVVETTTPAVSVPSRKEALAAEANSAPITRAEFVDEQERDALCQELRTSGGPQYDTDSSGVLVRISPLDGARQVVVPEALRPRVLRLAHYPVLAGHPGGCRMYHTLRRTYYWPSMAHDAYATVRECIDCARNRIKERSKTSFLKLFPAAAPLEFVCMDLLGPLPRTARHNRFLLVLTDRFSKLTRTVPLTNTSTPTVAKAFCEHWVFAYGAPVYLLTDNGSQFASKFFLDVCSILGVKQLFTTTYHPQTNGQAERFNRTLLQALRNYIAEHQRNWDQFSSAITFGYNCQVHRSTGIPPFELVVSRPPVSLSLENIPSWDGDVASSRNDFVRRLALLMASARTSLAKAQKRYKLTYDRGVREKNNNLQPGSNVFVRIEEFLAGTSKKLHPQAHGPYGIVSHDGRTFLLTNGEEEFRISSDRITRSPAPPGADQAEPPPEGGPSVVSPTPNAPELPWVGDIDPTQADDVGRADVDHPFAEFDPGPVDAMGAPMRLTRAAARRAAAQPVVPGSVPLRDPAQTLPPSAWDPLANDLPPDPQQQVAGSSRNASTSARYGSEPLPAGTPPLPACAEPEAPPQSLGDALRAPTHPGVIQHQESVPGPPGILSATAGLAAPTAAHAHARSAPAEAAPSSAGSADDEGAPPQAPPAAEPAVDENPLAGEFYVNRILEEALAEDGTPLFRIRWTGYGPGSDTWEPEEYLPPGMVSRFRARMQRRRR